MADAPEPLEQEAVIINELGLHARSAAGIAGIAQKATGKVWLIRDGQRADASSIIDMLTLACPRGTHITLSVDNPADIQILKDLVRLVENGFGE